jgi:hypothetical protein
MSASSSGNGDGPGWEAVEVPADQTLEKVDPRCEPAW